ncbi:MAG: hypothetical protein J1G38_05140 [Clostridiales bacterium]|nr:hypothetical protein [Clostridiales bacterium]
MKSLFAIDVTTKEYTGQEFILRKPDSELAQKVDASADTLVAYDKKSGVPLWFSIIEYILLFVGTICLLGFLNGCSEVGFDVAYKNGAAFIYIGGVSLVVWLAMAIYKRVHFKKVAKSPEVAEFLNEANELTDKIRENLNVPENSADVDVICRPFKIKNGKEKRGNMFYNYFNFSFWVFKEEENLCFSDACSVYGIPISSITEVVLVKKSVMVPQWNKDEPIKDPKYKKFVKTNNYGAYFIKPHYSVRFTHNDEEWEVLIPAYDIGVITELTGKYPAPETFN